MASAKDDDPGVMRTYNYFLANPVSHVFGSTGMLVRVVNSAVAGILAAVVAAAADAGSGLTVTCGVLVAVTYFLVAGSLPVRRYLTAPARLPADVPVTLRRRTLAHRGAEHRRAVTAGPSEQGAVEVERAGGDRRPGEGLDRAPAPGDAHRPWPAPGRPAARSAALAEVGLEARPGRAASRCRRSTCSIGTSRPVSPSATTSGMPPVAVATTGVSQAIASRLTMPIGS